MISLFKRFTKKTSDHQFNVQGAEIVDVRSRGEYSGGHISDSKNIPLSELKTSLYLLPDKNSRIITCCATGVRSATAKKVLEAEGYSKVSDGGNWTMLKDKIK